MSRKLPSKKSDEDLLKELESSNNIIEEQTETLIEDSFLAFLHFYNIEPGKNKINKKTIYALYKSWCQDDEPLTVLTFTKKMSTFFKTTHTDEKHYYFINQKVLNLHIRAFKLLQERKEPRYKVPVDKKHFDNFLRKYPDLKVGKKGHFLWVNFDVLYNLYDKWTYEIGKKAPLAKDQFKIFCKLYFPKYKLASNILYFYLDEDFMNIIKQEKISETKSGRFYEKTDNEEKEE